MSDTSKKVVYVGSDTESDTLLLGEAVVRRVVTPELNRLSETVGSTAGPGGNLVAIRRQNFAPHLTKDGVTVAASYVSKGFEGVAADLVRQSAIETGKRAGDGTTTATVLAVALYNALRDSKTGGTNHKALAALEESIPQIKELLESYTHDVTNGDDLYGVAYTSCNGDEELASLIMEVFLDLGESGAITVEEDRSQTGISLKKIEGSTVPAGFSSPYFVTQGTSRVELENPLIWFSLSSLQKPEDVAPGMRAAAKAGRPLLLICEGLGDDALALLLRHNAEGTLPSCAINSPYLGTMRVTAMQDLGAICGAIPTTKGNYDDDTIMEFMGGADKVVVESKLTSFFGPQGDREKVAQIMADLSARLAEETEETERLYLQKRIGSLVGKAAVIKIGGATHAQMVERKDRADDAVASARWALQEGIMPGAGSSLIRLSMELKDLPKELRLAFVQPVINVFNNALNDKAPEYFSRAVTNLASIYEKTPEENDGNSMDDIETEGAVSSTVTPIEKLSESIEERGGVEEGVRSEDYSSGEEITITDLDAPFNPPSISDASYFPSVPGVDLRHLGEVDDLLASGVIDSSYAVREAVSTAISSAIALSKLQAIILPDVE